MGESNVKEIGIGSDKASSGAPPGIVSLARASLGDLSGTGGKGANLIRLVSAGFPVPEGIVVTVAEYELFFLSNGLRERIVERLGRTDFGDRDSIHNCSVDVKAMIGTAEIGDVLAADISAALAKFSGDTWAVRSSAVAEDMDGASFAGQQDTFLGVAPGDVPDMVKRCWGSYWNERAIAYRHAAGIPQFDSGMAVVVQRMVDSDVSGVMFTTDPVDPACDSVVIESSWGLGESIVSGIVSPDRFACDRRSFAIIQKKLNRKTKGAFLSSGAKVVEIDQARQMMSSLTDEEVMDLTKMGLDIERKFGGPQDIEWAISKGTIYVLQSRPITTIGDEHEILWTRAYGDEYWADVTSPLFFSLLGEYLSRYVLEEGDDIMGYKELKGKPLLKVHKGHIYFNSEVLEIVFTYNPKFSRTRELLNYFPEKDRDRIGNAPTNWFRRIMAEVRIALLDSDGMITKTNAAYLKWAGEFVEKMKTFDATDLSKLSDEELLHQFYWLESAYLKHYRLIRYGMVTHSIATNLILKSWLKDWLDDRNGAIYSKLISGLQNNKTIETNNAIGELILLIKKQPGAADALISLESRAFLEKMETDPGFTKVRDEFTEFISKYGHRSHTREIYFPRWADDPTLVVDILKALVTSTCSDMEAMEKLRIEQRKAAEADVLQRVSRLRYGRTRKLVLKPVISLAQKYLMFRENQRFYLDHQLLRLRRLFMAYGRRLAERGIIEKADDVFFLSKEEIFSAAGGDSTATVKIPARKREFFRHADQLPPKFLKGRREFDDTIVRDSGAMQVTGTPSSPGIARGTIRVVESIAGLAQVKDGDILVTSNTDPGWTPVFSRIGALITETGGILSHGAVVSREYGIPAVTAVMNARQVFKDGQKVTVDGNEGLIFIEEV